MSVFAQGDIVRLKSGGPTMTVESLEDHPADAAVKGIVGRHTQVRAIWFDVSGARQAALFWPHTLAIDPKAEEEKQAAAKAAAEKAKIESDEARKKSDADARAAADRSAAFGSGTASAPAGAPHHQALPLGAPIPPDPARLNG